MPAKIKVPQDKIEEIKKLYESGLGARSVAEQVGFSRIVVRKVLEDLGIYDTNRKFLGRNLSESEKLDTKKEYDKLRYQENKNKISESTKEARLLPQHQINSHINTTISNHLTNNHDKNYFKYLPYSIDELQIHLESEFEPWMTWNNSNKNIKTEWDDNDSTTWSWKITHIIPYSKLEYTTLEDDNFVKYWTLDNFKVQSLKPQSNNSKNTKIEVPVEVINKMKILYESGLGGRAVAKQVGYDRAIVVKVLKELGVYDSNRKPPVYAYLQTEKCCKICKEIKPINNFRKRDRDGQVQFEPYCKDCEYLLIKERAKINARKNRKEDPIFALRRSVSHSIWKVLSDNDSSKNGESSLKYLPYTIEELKINLESKFEDWMSWSNYGIYKKNTWDDNDQSTWTWNLDHINPQSDLPYSSMEDESFKKCWALENLRPYSAKLNNIDGTNRTRHNK